MNRVGKRSSYLLCALCLVSCVLCVVSCVLCYAQEASKEEETLAAAKNAFEEGFYDLGLILFGRFMDKYPESEYTFEANFYIGQCYFYQKKYDQAIKVFRRFLDASAALSINPEPGQKIDAESGHPAKDRLYYWLAESFLKKNDFISAYDFYEKLVSENPLSGYRAHSFYSLGWCLFEQGKFREAKEKFVEFINKFPRDVLADEADFKVMECLYNLRDYLQLKDYIVNSSAKTTSHPAIGGALAKARKNNIEPDADGKIALREFYLAESYFYLEDYLSAIDNYTKVLELAADSNFKDLAYLGLGWSYLKHNDFTLAGANFEKALKAQTKRDAESALLGKALCLKMGGQYQEALAALDELIRQAETPPLIFEAYAGRARTLYLLKRYPEAAAAYKEARQYADKEMDSLSAFNADSSSLEMLKLGLGESEFKSGNLKAAIADFLGLSEGARNSEIKISSLVKLAQVYYASGEPNRAVDIYEKILKDYPHCQACDYVQLDLGLAWLNLKGYGRAIELFKKLADGPAQGALLEQAGFYLGKAYYENADYINSQKSLNYFVSKYPASILMAEALSLEGSSLISLKRFQDAYDIFKTALVYSQEPQLSANLELEMSDCLYELGRIDEALEKLEGLRAKYPDERILSLVLWRLSRHYFELNKFDLSRRYLLELLNSYPEASLLDDAYYLLGLSYEKDGRYQEAMDYFLKIKTGKEKMYAKFADLYKLIGKFPEAISYYRMSLAENAEDKSLVRFKLAESLEESGALGEALEEYARISQEPLLMVKVSLRCGKIYERQEDWQSAIKMYEKIAAFNTEESKFASERIAIIKENYPARRSYE